MFTIYFGLCTLFQKLVQGVVKKKNHEYESILYNSKEKVKSRKLSKNCSIHGKNHEISGLHDF